MAKRHLHAFLVGSVAGVLSALLLPLSAAQAAIRDDDPMIAGAKMCTQHLPRQEREYGIPLHLLAAISSTESGRYHRALGLRLPWPWTINAEGRGYFFETKQEAIAAVERLRAKGIRSIDVGCMQVNLHHHANAFSSLEEAFSPASNVAYAAGFLKRNFDELGSWRSATAAYHSRTPSFGSRYVNTVFEGWNRILTKISEARSGTLSLGKPEWTRPHFSRAMDVDTQMPKASGQTVSGNKRGRMKIIEVSGRTSGKRENGVFVIRPKAEPIQVAMAAPATTAPASEASGQFSPQAKVVRFGKGSSISVQKVQQPQFVFEN